MAVVNVTTKGQIVGLNADLMMLLSNTDGSALVTATRADGVWTIHAEGIDDVSAAMRAEAITAMNEHAQASTGAAFYTAQVQPGLAQQA